MYYLLVKYSSGEIDFSGDRYPPRAYPLLSDDFLQRIQIANLYQRDGNCDLRWFPVHESELHYFGLEVPILGENT